ncbi:1-deoxy-D-xylulose-5-phosphate reductoisomerase [Methylotenera sp.]|uniref:1-deoxy-D-xylulose-5-phosphate reductoisomerase n=1 Tax=Methylotenera sp. TaxID=2051956 RepID=UPI00273214B4|nr:1-deoxy-D-xylulose-5-phosphate reductoisomerase [Methylotenera sp.]MDP2071521.1 1-deoxy-D-xylulose-5-phosphate reductoisomerase [Methylotenera sp.]MDP3004956.1 1-deoxy-D-xylulose-5-phosphate reductoisomerase [Methylotenera sp.]
MFDKLSGQQSQSVTILGATGTIGSQTLDVISQHPERFSVFALSANNNVKGLFSLCEKYTPKFAVMLQEAAAAELSLQLKAIHSNTVVLHGEAALNEISSHEQVDIVMAAIVGSAGLHPAMAAAKAGKRILLANKETLVMAGNLFMQAVIDGGATLLPIDSEHNAIFQVMPQQRSRQLANMGVKRVLLTASGGPFRNASLQELKVVTRAQALNHPNWVMGPKITVDSATMMNKGLEVIEAHWLFNALPEQIDVVVHPQSVIHSMVEYIDGSVLAQLGNPDMRTPIAYGLGYPERLTSGVSSLDLLTVGRLDFCPPDLERFPCLRIAYDALNMGGTAPAILNAANEIAVEAFLAEKIGFMDIPHIIENVLTASSIGQVESIEQLVAIDVQARRIAKQYISTLC